MGKVKAPEGRGENSSFFDYTEDESEFIRAIVKFQQSKHRYPTYPETLTIIRELGYKKEVQ